MEHHDEQQHESQSEIHNPREKRTDGHRQARKIDFLNQIRTIYQAIRNVTQAIRKQIPWDKSDKIKNRIWHTVRRNFRQTAKKEAENDHRGDGLNNGPCYA